MNNVITLDNSLNNRIASLEEQQAAQGAYFDIIESPSVYTFGGELRENGNKTLVNSETGEFISEMSQNYVTVPNEEILGTLNEYIARSDIDITGAKCNVRVGYNGKRTAVDYIFPNHKISTGGGDDTYLSLGVINSFDGSTGLLSAFGGLRGLCLNTQFFGEVVSFKKYHNSGLDFDDVAETITRGLNVFYAEGDKWKRMIEAQINDVEAYQAILHYCGISKHDVGLTYTLYVGNKEGNRATKVDDMMKVYNKYKQELGQNQFALFNCLTHTAEHGAKKVKKPQSISTIGKRGDLVRAVSMNHLSEFRAVA